MGGCIKIAWVSFSFLAKCARPYTFESNCLYKFMCIADEWEGLLEKPIAVSTLLLFLNKKAYLNKITLSLR